MLGKFDFLLGDWDLEYRVPKSAYSEPATGKGVGTFQKALNDQYIYFDYSATLSSGSTAAHAIFAWDDKSKIYRYWWFENSGAFLTATCNFINDDILFINWHNTLLIQTFTKIAPDKVMMSMEHPVEHGKFESILEVILSRKESKTAHSQT